MCVVVRVSVNSNYNTMGTASSIAQVGFSAQLYSTTLTIPNTSLEYWKTYKFYYILLI
jgi:hypothetical protein